MSERLLTKAEWETIVNGLSDGSAYRTYREAITEAQDKKTRRATLHEVGAWLEHENGYVDRWYRSIAALKRGEAPWEVKS